VPGYDPRCQLWYKNTFNNSTKLVFTFNGEQNPRNGHKKEELLTISHVIRDENRNPVGVAGFDIML
jgi:hypothetical protein